LATRADREELAEVGVDLLQVVAGIGVVGDVVATFLVALDST
jgi:hypothetical protein